MPGFSSQSPICCIGASPLWALMTATKNFWSPAYASTRKAAMVGLIVSPVGLSISAPGPRHRGSLRPRLLPRGGASAPPGTAARWCRRDRAWSIDLIEQPDGTLPAPDPHTPAQCRVAVACALEATINKIRNRNASYVLDTNNHVGSLFSTVAPRDPQSLCCSQMGQPAALCLDGAVPTAAFQEGT